jgi:protein-disulfide isomerase/uncharacterized membrane protein
MYRINVIIPFVLSILSGIAAMVMWDPSDRALALFLGITSGWLVSIAAGVFHRWVGVLVSAVSALMVSLYLGVQHKNASESLFCTASETMDCGAVINSEYGTLFDVPVAFLGSGFYAGLIVLAVLALRGNAGYQKAASLVRATSVIAVLFSCYLAWASFQLGKGCPFCISMYGLNILILVFSILLVRDGGQGTKGTADGDVGDRSLNAFMAGAVIVLIGSMGWYSSVDDGVPEGDSVEDLAQLLSATEGPLTVDGTEPTLGPDAPSYTVVEFADFECPYCAKLFPGIHALPETHSDLQLVFKHYPLSPMCNDSIKGDRHLMACGAARAADCAKRQNRFWEMSKFMFMNQKHLDEEGIEVIAKQVGLDIEALATCMEDPLTHAKVKTDIAHGEEVGVHSTPSLFLKGLYADGTWVRVEGGPDVADKLVAAHKAGKPFPATPPQPKPHSH